MTYYKGLEYGGIAVTFGQVGSELLENNSLFESLHGKST